MWFADRGRQAAATLLRGWWVFVLAWIALTIWVAWSIR